jgi:RNA polymerase sigma-70 factor (ECF subfamily)
MREERAQIDRWLAERLHAGDDAALAAVYDAYAGAVYRQALAIVGSSADAEDVVQEVFLKLVRRRGGPIRELKAYLFTAARHEAASVLRQRRREQPDADAAAAPGPTPSAASSADALMLRNALAALPQEQRDVVIFKVYEDLTFAQIGERVRASAHTVASRYRYALKKLRAALGESDAS